jgi:hypothetical protein
MGLVIYGTRQVPIGFGEYLLKCPCCETNNWADVMVISNYYHLYWIPMFPFEKQANIICQKCGLKRYGRAFDANLISNFDEIKERFRHPWYTYTGVGILFFIFVAVVIASII